MDRNQLTASLEKILSFLDKTSFINRWLNFVGLGVLFLLVCFTFVDVFMRYVFNSPITGSLEITEIMLVMVVFLGIAAVQEKKGHVAIDVIIDVLSPPARLVLNTITTIVSMAVFMVLIWQIIVYIMNLILFNLETDIFGLPVAPFVVVIPLGCTLLFIVLLRDLLKNIVEGLNLQLMIYQWLLIFGVPLLLLLFAILWMQPSLWNVSPPVVGLIGSVFSLVCFFSGMPISFTLMMIGFIFMGHIRGIESGFAIIGIDLYQTTANNVWAAVAFFVLMGFFCLHTGLGRDLYYAAYKWMGRLFGGVAIATVGACAAFAAIVGAMIASTVTFTAVALPEMRRYKYSESLSTGVIASGATLGPLIPPSVTFIVYGVLTGESIGKLFLAGIIPGILIAVIFMISVYIRCRINPKLGPPGPKSTMKEKLISLKAGGPIAILFVLVIGGIYAGIFTPTEGGGIGAAGAFIIGIVMRRFTWKKFTAALLGAGQVIGMVFLMITGGTMFTRFMVSCNLNTILGNFFTELAMPPMIIAILIIATFFIFGCFTESMPLLLIGVPLFHPIIVTLGLDPIWFAVLIATVMHLGMITPPVGAILFALKGVEPHIPMSTIYRGVVPFILATIIAMAIMIIFPKIATWLPYLLK